MGGKAKPNTACIECGKSYYRAPYRRRLGRGLFCSPACYAKNRQSIPIEQRFWEKVDKRGDDECWPWLASIGSHGYGQLSTIDGPPITVHVYSYELANGPIPAGTVIRHSCDNRICVNPAHLLSGTRADNNRDFFERGHGNRGSISISAKLTESDVRAIRQDTRPASKIAADYGISKNHANLVRRRGSWKHLD